MSNTSEAFCRDGLIVPAMKTSPAAALFYLGGLLYCFLGIAIAADVFMCAIEKITSATRKVRLKRTEKNRLVADETVGPGDECTEVRVWNPTVANLTLMALGSSAPEILLSIIEIVGNNFRAGDLGPGTIVGSAAFNLLCISAICVMAIPSPKSSRIQETAVFAVTSVFSCFAYIWLLIILSFVSPGIVEIWEAALTLLFFAVLVVIAYLADIKIWKKKKADLEVELTAEPTEEEIPAKDHLNVDAVLRNFARRASVENKMQIACPIPDEETVSKAARQLSRIYPSLSIEDRAKLLAYKIKQNQTHNRLYYRMQAARLLGAAQRKTDVDHEVEKIIEETQKAEDVSAITERSIEFSARVYAIQKGVNRVTLKVVRHGPAEAAVAFRYNTVNGIAKKDLHFLPKSGTVRFERNESTKEINIDLIEGADWRPNHVFYVHLKLESDDGGEKTVLGRTHIALIRMPDDSESFIGEPMVEFAQSNYVVKESERYVRAFVTRRGRHDGRPFSIHYETVGVTAQSDVDYKSVRDGVLHFVGHEYEKYIDVRIYDDLQEEKDETFNINIISTVGEVTVGPKKRAVVTIVCDDNVLKNITNVRKLMPHYLSQISRTSDDWFKQIVYSTSVNAGDLDNATLWECFMHAASFPWKFLFAFVPPPHVLGGWLCFLVALALIGVITAIVGDLASIFGCMVGLKDSITAITFVALGTSLPDTFASKIAAENDETADNAIGNVTGSNSVNVFLGLGLPWLVAAIYWAAKGEDFRVEAGSLGFSVAVFMVTSLLCLGLLVLRRRLGFFGKGELGGPAMPKIISATFLVVLWGVYILFSVLQAYGYIAL